ncbi:hypothetical protein Tco_0089995 [Tanacetum coccineum]
MAQVSVSVSIVDESTVESVSQLPRERLLRVLIREVCVDVRKVGEYMRISRELRESVRSLSACIFKLRALGDCEDGYENVRLFERLRLDNMEKGIRLCLMMKETQLKIAFVRELESVAGVTVTAKTAMFLKEMMDKEGSRESMGEDYRLASKINRMTGEFNNVVVVKDQFLEELNSLSVRPVPAKMAEFLREIQTRDKETVTKLQILEREMELNARKKDLFIQ